MTKIKICGITNLQDATWSATLGVDYLGFNFYKRSPRKISISMAQEIISKIPPVCEPVGIFVDEEINVILDTVKKCNLKLIQLHGKETPDYCLNLKMQLIKLEHPEFESVSENDILQKETKIKIIKAFRIKGEGTLKYLSRFKDIVDYFLLDTYIQGIEGGTGETFNWDLAVESKKYNKPIFLAGGLTPENVKEAIQKVQPYAVDTASGVERLPRRKDFDKLKKFILNAR